MLFLFGCNGKPSDVPKLFPCKITVKKEATPIVGANVILGSDVAGSMWASSGTTDSSGVAKIHTNRLKWQSEGIPAGEYTVVLSKSPKLESISVAEYQKLEPAEQDKYREEEAKRFDALSREIPV
ncbi:MAG: hypothetical protein LBN39_07375, partial [Planctomycetaceae bacterium]|nr:hypothetical protein [Planctomycetaceae bacterium]